VDGANSGINEEADHEQDYRSAIRKYVGLDVDKDSVSISVDEESFSEVRHVGTVGGDLAAVGKALAKLGEAGTVSVVYEAGPTGYGLYRWLRAKGYRVAVIAPSLIPRKAGDRVKTDRRDATLLARLARAGELTAVTVPDAGDEALRDLTRAREDAVKARLTARQQLKALLLRQGIRYDGKSSWTKAHQRWLATVRLPHGAQQLVFTEYWQMVDRADALVDRLTQALREAVSTWRYGDVVSALMTMRGIDLVTAATIVAEIGDIRRFDHPRKLMAFLGLVPSEHSSGARTHKGSITKTGNAHARRVLVEAAWNHRFPARIGHELRKRQQDQSETIRDLSWKAQTRLCKRYRQLTARGLHQNKVCVAVARELTGFIWAIAGQVPSPG